MYKIHLTGFQIRNSIADTSNPHLAMEVIAAPMEPPNKQCPTEKVELKVYKRRIWMLFLFSFLSMLCGMLFTHYTSMANVNGCFYDVSQEAVNWTGNIFFIMYLVLVFPVSSLIDYIDLKYTVLCASFFNTTGKI